jgi:outer membrane lipoprotein-sorting protein
MKKLFFASVAALLAAAWAQTSAASDLKSEISKIESVNSSWNDISADFEQKTFIALLDKSVMKKGSMHVKKGGKFRIEYKG